MFFFFNNRHVSIALLFIQTRVNLNTYTKILGTVLVLMRRTYEYLCRWLFKTYWITKLFTDFQM